MLFGSAQKAGAGEENDEEGRKGNPEDYEPEVCVLTKLNSTNETKFDK